MCAAMHSRAAGVTKAHKEGVSFSRAAMMDLYAACVYCFAGAKCGFLAAMGALAAGAHRAFIPEERASLKDIKVCHISDGPVHSFSGPIKYKGGPGIDVLPGSCKNRSKSNECSMRPLRMFVNPFGHG
jgi:hypothetical protein